MEVSVCCYLHGSLGGRVCGALSNQPQGHGQAASPSPSSVLCHPGGPALRETPLGPHGPCSATIREHLCPFLPPSSSGSAPSASKRPSALVCRPGREKAGLHRAVGLPSTHPCEREFPRKCTETRMDTWGTCRAPPPSIGGPGGGAPVPTWWHPQPSTDLGAHFSQLSSTATRQRACLRGLPKERPVPCTAHGVPGRRG